MEEEENEVPEYNRMEKKCSKKKYEKINEEYQAYMDGYRADLHYKTEIVVAAAKRNLLPPTVILKEHRRTNWGVHITIRVIVLRWDI